MPGNCPQLERRRTPLTAFDGAARESASADPMSIAISTSPLAQVKQTPPTLNRPARPAPSHSPFTIHH